MAEPNEKPADQPTARQLAAARKFVGAHGESSKASKAIVENLGRAGARVVLIGADGAMGDVIVAGPTAGSALVDAVAGLEPAQWDAETVGATVIGAQHRRRMAGR